MQPRLSVARSMLLFGIATQILNFAILIFSITGFSRFVLGLTHGDGQSISITVIVVLYLILIVPVWRGQKWALIVSLLLLVSNLFFAVKFALPGLAQPDNALDWIHYLLDISGALLGVIFGVVALLEAFGRLQPAAWAGSRQSTVIKLISWLALGAFLQAMAVLLAPPAAGALKEAPDALVQIRIENGRFVPNTIDVAVGKTTAIFLVDKDVTGHSFDVDALNVHTGVAQNGAAVAVVKPTSPGSFEFYCSIPGHKAAGMVGTIEAK